jgi:putative tryptophan/tyrosine transport system substrate-binding protein
MRRREFIAGLGGVAAWPLAARAQQGRIPVIGFIGSSPERPRFVVGFLKGLGETGFAEGREVAIEYRWVEGQNDRLPAFVSDLVNRRVSVIAALESTAGALAAKAATRTIPIVFRIGGDPVASGIVSSLNRPDANITGITNLGDELEAKRLESLRELLPPDTAVALLVNPTNANAAAIVDAVQAAARVLGLRLLTVRARTQADIEAAFASISRQDIRGLVVTTASLFFQHRDQLITMAARRAIPAIYPDRLFSEAGGLMSYGTDIPDGYRLAGTYVGRILKGEKPSNLPVQQSTKVELLLNIKTAKALGMTFPQTLLARADEVIE